MQHLKDAFYGGELDVLLMKTAAFGARVLPFLFGSYLNDAEVCSTTTSLIPVWHQPISKKRTKIKLFATVFFIQFALLWSHSAVAMDPLLAYSKDSAYDIFYSTYGASSWDTEANGIDEDSYHWWVVGKTHPNKDEQVAVFVETGAIPHLFASLWDGTNWDDGSGSPFGDANDLGTVYVDDYRCFDAAYEQSSGHLLVVAASGSGGRINYWTWDGTSWTGPTEYNVIDSDRYNWIKLAAKPGTDEIAVILADEGSDVTGLIWDGSSFGNKLQLSTSLSSTTTEAVSVAYEQTGATKEAIFVWGQAADVWSKRWDGTWVSGNPTVSNVITGTIGWLRLKADLATDDLLLGVEDNATSSPDMDVAEWDGSAWSTPKITSNPTLFGNAANHRAFDVIYDDSNKATVVFSTTVGTEYRNEDAWSTDQTDVSASEAYWVQLERDGDSTVHLAFHEATSGSDDLETYIYTTSGGWVSKGTVSTANDLEDNGNTRRVEPFALTAEKTATAPATYYTPVSAVDPGWSNHRKRAVFYNGSRYFLLYSKGDGNIYYQSSADNVAWSGEASISGVSSTSVFDIYLINDTKFDLAYRNSSNYHRVVTCTISDATITCGSSSANWATSLVSPEVVVARSGTGDRIYVASGAGDRLRIYSADQTGDAQNVTSWAEELGSKESPEDIAMVPYQNSDQVLVINSEFKFGRIYAWVVTRGSGASFLECGSFSNIPDITSPIRITDTDFRFIIRPPNGAMEEWKWNGSSCTQVDANVDPENETDQDSPSLFYDRLSGDMYVFSVDTGTDDIERHYKASGNSWQAEVIADNGEATTHTYPITQMHEPPYGSSRTCNALVWAYRTTGYDLNVGSETLTACPDTSPPTPDPMTFATPPDEVDTTSIDMTATTATDPSTPVEYLFTFSACGSNGGTGGSDSSWQTSTSYTDSGLQPNKCYGYTVTARDSATPTPNTGTASAVSEAYTSANVPGTPTLSNATSITLDLTNDENGNPASSPTTLLAVQVVTTTDGTWLNQYVDGDGNPSATAVWMSDATLDGLKLRGLQPSTTYGVKVKARNQDGDETILSAEGQGTTTAPGPYLEQIHYRWFNDDGAEGAASRATPEDTPLSSVASGSPIRLRLEVSNEGPADDSGPTTYLLEYATSTAGPWTPVEVASVATNSHWQMVDSSYYGDGDGSNNIDPGLTDENGSFLAGKLKDTSNLTVDLPLTATQFTEIEYCFQATSKAVPGSTYYFRLSDDGTALHDYLQYGRVTLSGGGSWLNSDWLYRKHFRIDSSRVAGNLTNFPVLISTTDLDWRDSANSGHVAQADGGDIVFTAGDGVTKIDHEIEKYDPATGELVAWVEVPSLSGSADTGLYIYYGNSTLAEGENQWNAAGVWDSDYVGVWHLKESTGTQCNDSTSNANHGTPSSPEAPEQVPGQLDGSLYFDDDGDADERNVLVTDTDNSLDLPSAMTVSAWVKTSDIDPDVGLILMKWSDTASQKNYWLGKLNDTSIAFYVDESENVTASLGLINDGVDFHHIVGVADPNSSPQKLRIYVDGVESNSIDWDGTSRTGDADFRIGNSATVLQEFGGTIDEVRISSIVHSAEWIETEYNNQKAPAAFYTVGIEESPGAGADPFNNGWSYRKRLTIDAAQISADLTNFPVLVKTTDPDLTKAQADFDDILFTAANGKMKLDHEIEKYNSSTGELMAWVEVPIISSTGHTDIYIYYGNASAVDQRNPTGAGVWEPNYVGVWHLKETSGNHVGSTWNYHTGTPQGALNQDTTGPIDGADYFNGSDAYVDVSHDDSLNFGTDDFTIEAWVKSTQAQVLDEYPKILEKLVDSPSKQGYRLVLYSSTISPYPLFDVWSGGSAEGAEATVDIRDDSWHHLVGVKTSGEVRIYVDGASSGSALHTLGTTSSTSDLYFGRSVPWDSDYFEGTIDEVRISKTARSAAWTEAQYNNISNPLGFFLTGIEEGPGTDGDPFQNGWTYRKRLTIDASRVAADFTNFPVLINTTDADWKEDDTYSGHVAQDDGGDIIFTAGDGVTRLYHEIEKYEPSTGELVAWVKVPSLSSSTNTNIYIYYGNTSLDVDENQWNTAGLWDAGYKGIYHFGEDPSITTDGDCAGGVYEICDATLNDNDGDMQGGMTSGDLVQAKVGDGLDFDGGDDSFDIKSTGDFDRSVITVGAWINTSSTAERRIMMNNTSGTNDWCFTMEDNSGSASVLFSNSPNADDNQMTSRTLADGLWHHVVAISDPVVGNIKIYVDGYLASTATNPGETFGGGDVSSPIIGRHDGLAGYNFLGKMDEVRVYDGALTAEWIATEFKNQHAPAAFYTVGIEEASGTGANPFNNGWSYRKRITIDSAQVPSDQTNFPVLIKTTDPDLISGGGHVAQADGGDILFTSSTSDIKLDHEIEKYDPATGELVVWVEVRSLLSTSDTDIYLYYGNGTAVDQWNPTGAGVWEPNYKGVWHIHDDFNDSTAEYNNATNSGSFDVAGKIANGQSFDGVSNYIYTSNFVTGPQELTVEAWFKTNDPSGQKIFGFEGNQTGEASTNYDRHLYVGDDGKVYLGCYGGGVYTAASTNTYTDNVWHHVVGVRNDATDMLHLYIDGKEVDAQPNPSIENTTGYWRIGSYKIAGWPAAPADGYFPGTIDEVRISHTARSADWVQIEYNNQSNPEGFYTIGIEEQPGTVGDPFQSGWTYRKRLTVDASRVASDLTNFPVLINTTDADWIDDAQVPSGHVAQADGGDIMFTAGDGVTKLDHEIEKYDPTTGELVAWVEVRSLSGTNNTDFYIYYGNTTLDEDENQWNSAGVWDSSYMGVWHLEENVTDEQTGGVHSDSTWNYNDGAQNYNGAVTGIIAGGQQFDGAGDYIDVPDSSTLDMGSGQDFTVSAWVKSTQPLQGGKWPALVRKINDAAPTSDGYALVLFAETSDQWYFETYDDTVIKTASANSVRDDTWHYVTGIRIGADFRVYEDGVQIGVDEPAGSGDISNSYPLRMGNGCDTPPTGVLAYQGAIDEVRVSKIVRSAEWVQTEYNNQKSPAAFYTVGIEETTGTGADPFNNGWTYRKRITIDSAQVGCDLTNFPVLVTTTDSDLAASAQADFDDILFTAADGTTKLDHEIEDYDSGSGKLVAWVEVRSVSSTSDTDIYLYYGNGNAVDQRNPTGAGVWEPNYLGVWHLKETVTDEETTGTHYDSTSNDNDGSQSGNAYDATGQINGAQVFDGTDDYVDAGNDASLVIWNSDFTWQAWAKLDANSADGDVITKAGDGTTVHAIELRYDFDDDNWQFNGFDDSASTFKYAKYSQANAEVGRWYHLAGVRDGTSIKIYVDGVAGGVTDTLATLRDSSSFNLLIGRMLLASDPRYFPGSIDEVRVSRVARDACWIEAEHNNQSDPAAFYTIGLEEQDDTESDPLQNGWTYRKRLTIDASRVAGDLTNFPVLISTIDEDWMEDDSYGGHVAQTDGGDIMFTAGDGVTKLDHEIEKYDPATGDLVAWVEVRSLSGNTNTNIYIYYGNTSLAEGENQWNETGVWDSDYVGVWHLADTQDATSNGHDGTNMGATPWTSGEIDGAYDFNNPDPWPGSQDHIYITNNGDLSTLGNTSNTKYTVSFWGQLDQLNDYRHFVSKLGTIGIGGPSPFEVWVDSVGPPTHRPVFSVKNGSTTYQAMSSIALSADTWYHISGVRDGDNLTLYIDGISRGTDSGSIGDASNTEQITIGQRGDDTVYLDGRVDEFRIAKVARSAAWIETEFNNQKAPAAFYTVGIEESYGTTADPFHNGWQYNKKITILASEVAGDLTNFPVLIKTTDPDWADSVNGGNAAQSDGGDILFVAGDGHTKLDHQIERYDETTGELVAWVEVRSLSSSEDTDIYIFYGNANAVDQWNPTGAGVWEPNYEAVWHLAESPNDGVAGHVDSTWNDNTGTPRDFQDGDGGSTGANGMAAGGDSFKRGVQPDDRVEMADHKSLEPTDDMTFSIWAWFNTHNASLLVQKNDNADPWFSYQISMDASGIPTFGWENSTRTGHYNAYLNSGVSTGAWHHIVGVHDGTTLRIYVDGTDAGTTTDTTTGSMLDSDSTFLLGNNNNFNQSPDAILDEVRISKVARSAAWIATEHSNQSDPANFYIVDTNECDNSSGLFDNRTPITIHGYQVSGTSGSLTNFPLLVSIENDPELRTVENGGKVFSDGGYDIVFRADDGTTGLDHEIEHYDGVNGTLVAWVRIPSLSKSTDTLIYMYYGNCSITTPSENPEGVWNEYYKGVWHLKENGAGSADEYRDSTQYGNHGQGGEGDSAFVPTQVSGRIAYGQDFAITPDSNANGEDEGQLIDCGNDASLDIDGNQITLQAWVKYDSATHPYMGPLNHKGWSNGYRLIMQENSSNMQFHLPGSSYSLETAETLSTGSWHHLVATYDGTRMRIYLDGTKDENELEKLDNILTVPPTENEVWIGHGDQPKDKAWSYPWDGQIDEVRISNIARSADWIKTEFYNQSNPSAFYSIGTDSSPATAVNLVSFAAKGESNSVIVEWETAQELNNMGFHLYRSRNSWGPFNRLTDKLISSLTSSVVGQHYSFEDKDVTPGEIYYYQLEDFDVYGKKTLHGPICVDWDDDGLPDDWEIAHGLNPDFDDADLDWDGDGLTNLEEYLRGTDPFNPDTDGDGILDGDEGVVRDPDDEAIAETLGPGVYLVESDETGTTLELRTDSFDFDIVQAEGQEFERLRIKEYIHGFTAAVGKPELPLKGILLDIPQGNGATLTVLETEDEVHTGYRIYPVPEKSVDDQGQLAHVGETFVIDEAAYSMDAFYPDAVALLGKEYIFRGQQKQQIFFYPLTFNPATGELRHFRRIRVRVEYVTVGATKTSGPEPTVWSPPLAEELTVDSFSMAESAFWEPPSGASSVYKILVSEEGIYRLTKTWLEARGVDVAAIDLSQVRIYNLGQEIAISVYDENGDNQFDLQDYIDFYGKTVEETYAKYTTGNIYWFTLEGGAGAPSRMAAIDGTPGSASIPLDHTSSVHHEEDRKYWASAPGSDSLDRYFFDPYLYGEDIAWPGAGDPVDFTLFLPDVSGKGNLTIRMAGTWAPYHQVAVSLNGTPLGTYSWDDIAFYEATIEDVDLVEGNNTVTLQCLTGVDAIAVDWFEVAYPRSFQANGDTLRFTHETGYLFRVSEFSANNLLAFDITSPVNVDRVVNFETTGTGPYTLDFEPETAAGERTYLVLTSDQVKTPAAISEDVYGNLANSANGADYILITHRDLGWDVNGDPYLWLNDLTALRQARGLRVKVVDAEDIFDEFSYGIFAPEAILDFLAYAYTNWTPPAPQYVLLVGDSTRNPKNNPDPSLGTDSVMTYIPTYLTFTEHMGETATDEWFARVSGDDAISDLYVGRLPAKSAAEATVMVNKILAYEGSLNTKSWEKNVLLLADDQRDGPEYEYEADFETMNDDVAALLPDAMNDPFKGYLNDYFDADNLSSEIIARINSGTLMVNYSGHSSVQILANHRINYENIFNNSDVDILTNSTMYPLFVGMGCLSGNFVFPEDWNFPSLAEALLRAQAKGAAAALMSTGQTTTEGQHILDSALFDAIFNRDVRVLGPAISGAKQTLMANGDSTYEEVNETFLLFGDPAMTLKVPLPERPEGLKADGNSSGVLLTWDEATDCNGSTVSGYNLYRSTTPGGPYAKVNTSLITGTQYDDLAVSSTTAQYTSSSAASTGTTFYYVVTSVDVQGDESVYSREASGGTQSANSSESESSGGGGGGCFVNTLAGK